MDQKLNSLGKFASVVSEVFGLTQFPFLFWFVAQKVFFDDSRPDTCPMLGLLDFELGEDGGTDGTSLIAGPIDSWCLDRWASFLF